MHPAPQPSAPQTYHITDQPQHAATVAARQQPAVGFESPSDPRPLGALETLREQAPDRYGELMQILDHTDPSLFPWQRDYLERQLVAVALDQREPVAALGQSHLSLSEVPVPNQPFQRRP